MTYREKWFAANPPSPAGTYQCVYCHGWFHKSQIDIDHRIPKRDGGTDDLYNLQPTCKHCNCSKRDRQSNADNLVSAIGAIATGNAGNLAKSIGKQKLKDFLGFKYKR